MFRRWGRLGGRGSLRSAGMVWERRVCVGVVGGLVGLCFLGRLCGIVVVDGRMGRRRLFGVE